MTAAMVVGRFDLRKVAVKSPYVYDKAKYHLETITQHGLSGDHASNHTVVFLRWLIENDLMSHSFIQGSEGKVEAFLGGKCSIHDLYDWWDCCLTDDMLSKDGDKFAMYYFDFEEGNYLHDYIEHLQGKLLSEFHIEYTEKGYQVMKKVIGRRYKQWKARKKKK